MSFLSDTLLNDPFWTAPDIESARRVAVDLASLGLDPADRIYAELYGTFQPLQADLAGAVAETIEFAPAAPTPPRSTTSSDPSQPLKPGDVVELLNEDPTGTRVPSYGVVVDMLAEYGQCLVQPMIDTAAGLIWSGMKNVYVDLDDVAVALDKRLAQQPEPPNNTVNPFGPDSNPTRLSAASTTFIKSSSLPPNSGASSRSGTYLPTSTQQFRSGPTSLPQKSVNTAADLAGEAVEDATVYAAWAEFSGQSEGDTMDAAFDLAAAADEMPDPEGDSLKEALRAQQDRRAFGDEGEAESMSRFSKLMRRFGYWS